MRIDVLGVGFDNVTMEEAVVRGVELIHQEGAVYIYQNSRTQSLGKFFTQTMTQEQYEANQDNLNTRALLTDTLILEDENEKTLTDN